jgi:biotin transport system substrate-specific component
VSFPAASARRPALAVAHTIARETAIVLGLAVALAAASRIVLPLTFTPVPVSAQTFVVLVAGALIGARRAGAGGLTYLAFGVAGVPWFAVTGGATLGYIAGFAVAGWMVGRAAEAGLLARRGRALIVMAGAHAVIYVLGAIVLALVLGLGAMQAFMLGVAPFLIGDTLKVVAAASIAPALVRTGAVNR